MSSNRSTTSMSKRLRLTAGSAGLALAALVLAAGCGSSTKTASGAASAAPTSQPAAPASQPAAPAPATTIAARTTSLGSIVVDSSGRTLYRFDKDMPGSGSSACNAACATTWPPAAVSGQPKAGTGVAGAIGQITRADGSQQVTLDGHPLYRFSGDQASGDTNGDGFGGIWHVVSAGATTGASTAAASSPSGPSGY
jgi:predicted lipoprotein with Yx(FWY)xxD motif